MSPSTRPYEWTYAEYARLPEDGKRHEVLDGRVLVTPSPTTGHQRVARRLFRLLDDYVAEHGLGEVFWELDVLFPGGQFLRPDLVYVPEAERGRLGDRGVEGVPGLVVEIVSASSGRIDKMTKPPRYGDFGVPEFWAVDPGRKAVLVWAFDQGATEPRVEAERVEWRPEADRPPLVFEVAVLFEEEARGR